MKRKTYGLINYRGGQLLNTPVEEFERLCMQRLQDISKLEFGIIIMGTFAKFRLDKFGFTCLLQTIARRGLVETYAQPLTVLPG